MDQTDKVGEIIVVDDGSTDGTDRIVPARFPSVLYIHQNNMGVSHARNTGIALASYEWIAFLDSDDRWFSTKVETQMQALHENPEYRICHTDEIWIRRGVRVNPKIKHKKSGGDLFNRCLSLCVISPSSVLIHKEVFECCGLFDTGLPVCEDYDLWLRISLKYPVLFVDMPLIVKFGGHTDQLSRRYWGMDRFRIIALEKLLESSDLDDTRQKAVLHMLVEKIDIYSQGAKKRKKDQDVLVYAKKREHYLSLLDDV
jgi:glycosyltransferase involved in cell wall biosynthesis